MTTVAISIALDINVIASDWQIGKQHKWNYPIRADTNLDKWHEVELSLEMPRLLVMH